MSYRIINTNFTTDYLHMAARPFAVVVPKPGVSETCLRTISRHATKASALRAIQRARVMETVIIPNARKTAEYDKALAHAQDDGVFALEEEHKAAPVVFHPYVPQ